MTVRAVLFDLDGVLVSTATVHARAWEEAFNRALARVPRSAVADVRPFDPVADYELYVDGRPRLDGIRSFLAARGIALAEGDASDSGDALTVHGIGRWKNDRFLAALRAEGPVVFRDAIALLGQCRRDAWGVAIVTSSRNAETILGPVGISPLVDALVDGTTAADRDLAGKPAPDTFLHAAAMLQLPPADCIVIEDAAVGVEAGRRGRFGLVVGLDRRGDRGAQLMASGADVVVRNLDDISTSVLADLADRRSVESTA